MGTLATYFSSRSSGLIPNSLRMVRPLSVTAPFPKVCVMMIMVSTVIEDFLDGKDLLVV